MHQLKSWFRVEKGYLSSQQTSWSGKTSGAWVTTASFTVCSGKVKNPYKSSNCNSSVMGAMPSKPDPNMEGIKAYQVDKPFILVYYSRHIDSV